MGEEGAAAIADFVKQGKKLKELNLYMNDIGTGGAYKASNPVSSFCSSAGHLQPDVAVITQPHAFCFVAWVIPCGGRNIDLAQAAVKTGWTVSRLHVVLFHDMGEGVGSTLSVTSTDMLRPAVTGLLCR